jgi:hypothetical protein
MSKLIGGFVGAGLKVRLLAAYRGPAACFSSDRTTRHRECDSAPSEGGWPHTAVRAVGRVCRRATRGDRNGRTLVVRVSDNRRHKVAPPPAIGDPSQSGRSQPSGCTVPVGRPRGHRGCDEEDRRCAERRRRVRSRRPGALGRCGEGGARTIPPGRWSDAHLSTRRVGASDSDRRRAPRLSSRDASAVGGDQASRLCQFSAERRMPR